MIGYIPSPPSNGITVGSFELHFYGLLIAIGVLAAAWLAQKRWVKLGGFAGTIVPIAFWAVVVGLIGARLYSVATSWQQDTGGNPVEIVEIWNGGLGIWGGVAGGVLGGWLAARHMRLPLPPLLDVVAPAVPLGQAIGRWGNYFNQELFGLPSKLPWAVRITDQAQLANIYPPRYRPPIVDGAYLPGTFQPTFLYECIWDLATVGLVLLIERKVKLRRGYLFAVYAAIYTFGRFFTEYLRIDPAHRYLGLRLNDWTSIGVFLCATALLLLKGRPKPGDELVGEPLPVPVQAAEQARAERARTRGEPEGAAEEAGTAAGGGEAKEADGAVPVEPDGAEVKSTAPPGPGVEEPEKGPAEVDNGGEASPAPAGSEPAGPVPAGSVPADGEAATSRAAAGEERADGPPQAGPEDEPADATGKGSAGSDVASSTPSPSSPGDPESS